LTKENLVTSVHLARSINWAISDIGRTTIIRLFRPTSYRYDYLNAACGYG
jgi:hypothetical protein